MGARRTAWHYFFGILLRERGPRWIEVRAEVPLGSEPPRVDYLLLRRIDKPSDDPGRTLRGLWPLLPVVTIAELKTLGRPYRSGNLDRLWSYLHAYFADAKEAEKKEEEERPQRRGDLASVIIVPDRTPTLDADLDAMGLVWNDLGGGYAEVTGGLFRLFVVQIDPVAEGEDDDLLRLFGHEPEHTEEARRFWARMLGSEEAGMKVEQMEGYDEVMQKLLDRLTPQQRMAGLAPKQVLSAFEPQQLLSAFEPQQLLSALKPEQILPALPDALLRALSDDYIDSLPNEIRDAIRKRIGR